MSPPTISVSRPSRLPRGLPARTSARRAKPALDSSRPTAEPTKPEAPVMKKRSLAGTIFPCVVRWVVGASACRVKAVLGEGVNVRRQRSVRRPYARRGKLDKMTVRIAEIKTRAAARPLHLAFDRDSMRLQAFSPGVQVVA